MIGNDIVDLEAASRESNWKRKGFLEKLFTAEEREMILASHNPELYLWLLWSKKEAAYKAHQRHFDLKRSYQPKTVFCQSISFDKESVTGKVISKETTYITRSSINKNYIHTTASFSEEERLQNKVLSSSENIKSALISHFASIYNIKYSDLFLEKDKNAVPFLTCQGHILSSIFSLSHHGRFSAYSLSLMNY